MPPSCRWGLIARAGYASATSGIWGTEPFRYHIDGPPSYGARPRFGKARVPAAVVPCSSDARRHPESNRGLGGRLPQLRRGAARADPPDRGSVRRAVRRARRRRRDPAGGDGPLGDAVPAVGHVHAGAHPRARRRDAGVRRARRRADRGAGRGLRLPRAAVRGRARRGAGLRGRSPGDPGPQAARARARRRGLARAVRDLGLRDPADGRVAGRARGGRPRPRAPDLHDLGGRHDVSDRRRDRRQRPRDQGLVAAWLGAGVHLRHARLDRSSGADHPRAGRGAADRGRALALRLGSRRARRLARRPGARADRRCLDRRARAAALPPAWRAAWASAAGGSRWRARVASASRSRWRAPDRCGARRARRGR